MRIVAGTARGTKLSAPEGLRTRPVLDRVKESWFAVLVALLGEDGLGGARVLDLYAGVGSLGLEALSRGAASCVFVERDPACLRLLDEHLARARLADRAEVRRGRVEDALAALAEADSRFEVVFVDPPFALARDEGFWGEGGVVTAAGRLLNPGRPGLVTVRREAPSRAGAGPVPGVPGLALADRRTWCRNEVLFLEGQAATGRPDGGES